MTKTFIKIIVFVCLVFSVSFNLDYQHQTNEEQQSTSFKIGLNIDFYSKSSNK